MLKDELELRGGVEQNMHQDKTLSQHQESNGFISSDSCYEFNNNMNLISLKKRILSRHKVMDRRKTILMK